MAADGKLRCLIAAGGTAGHVLPALAVAEALVARGAAVTFAGSPDRVEARLVPEAGYELDTFRVSGLPRRPGLAQLRALLLAGRAPAACGRILERRKPDVVLGAGGYVGAPMVVAARRRRIPAATTEADAHLGLANRLVAPLATRVFLAYELPRRRPPKYRVTGRPIPPSSRPWDRADARARFDLPAEHPVLGIFGALAGAHSLNELALEAFGAAGPPVLHVCGERDFEWLRSRVRRDDYRLIPSEPEFGAVLGAIDLAVSRAGGTVWELAAAGVPAVLVPYPFATGDHQRKNAEYFAWGGGAIVAPQTELGTVPELARSLLGDPRRLSAMSTAMRRLARPNAADEIAEELIALAGARR
jgi:UDP-N-acetylglucosamine--N-acetylmuramyl-(pentapeptide) pyrophosphoryl-undecaprenol N-acetylglucosamine transferase